MTTRVESGGPPTGVVAGSTAARVTPPPARPFHQIMTEAERTVVSGAEASVRRMPGGPILAAAFRSPTPSSAGAGTARAEGPTGTASPGGVEGAGSLEDALSRQADQNLYYLELQERISAQSRAFSALSNVLKAKHDTAKNAINNIR